MSSEPIKLTFKQLLAVVEEALEEENFSSPGAPYRDRKGHFSSKEEATLVLNPLPEDEEIEPEDSDRVFRASSGEPRAEQRKECGRGTGTSCSTGKPYRQALDEEVAIAPFSNPSVEADAYLKALVEKEVRRQLQLLLQRKKNEKQRRRT